VVEAVVAEALADIGARVGDFGEAGEAALGVVAVVSSGAAECSGRQAKLQRTPILGPWLRLGVVAIIDEVHALGSLSGLDELTESLSCEGRRHHLVARDFRIGGTEVVLRKLGPAGRRLS